MHINIFLILFIIILGLVMKNTNNDRRLYIVLCSIILVFVAAMRSPEWFTFRYNIDTVVYSEQFKAFQDLSWKECWDRAYIRYFGIGGDDDIGYIVLFKVVGWFTNSFYVFSIIADLLFFIPFGIILYRYTTHIRQLIFAFVFYIAMIQVFLLGGARQIFTIGFDMIALLAMVDKKRWLSMLFFLVGVTIHFSSFLFLAPLLMIWFNTSPRTLKRLHVACFILFPLIWAFPNQVIVFLGETSGVEKYANYGMGEIQGGAITFILLIEMLSLFCLIAIRQFHMQHNSAIRLFYVMIPFFTLLAPLIRSNGSMIRITLYYHMFLVLLVPYALDCLFEDKDRNLVYFVAIIALAFLALQGGGTEYYFFWQK